MRNFLRYLLGPDEWDGRFTFFHSCLVLRWPVTIDIQQIRLTLGITCPRHRRLLKNALGPLGRFVPYREWSYADPENPVLVSVKEAIQVQRQETSADEDCDAVVFGPPIRTVRVQGRKVGSRNGTPLLVWEDEG